ncbi:MAG: YicC/YloC family endoribonuclease [Myxococcota bacterium]
MIRSMTGFGRAQLEADGGSLTVELRTVNHRHLDITLRLPRALSGLEAELRTLVAALFSRGKLDVVVSTPPGSARSDVALDQELAAQYLTWMRELSVEGALPHEPTAAELLALPGVIRVSEQALDEDAVRPALRAAVEEAAVAAVAMREREGEALDRELRARLAQVRAHGEAVSARSGEVVAAVRDRLAKRAEQLREETGAADESRLLQEIVIAADRMDVTEEVVRLASHVSQFEATLDAERGGPVGRKLEFLLQEMLREVNTIGSKAADAPIAHRVVELKTELERMREQALNVE